MRNTLLIAIPALFLAQAAVAQNCNKLNVPVQWTIHSMYVDQSTPAAITGDGSPYVNGQSGVEAVIQVCSGSFDATMNPGRSRSVTFNLNQPLTANPPSWTSASVSGAGSFNVRNLWFVPSGHTRATEYTFTTLLGSAVPTKSGSWNLAMRAVSDTVAAPLDYALINAPYPNSPVVVHHCPAGADASTNTCLATGHETWLVYPSPNPTGSGYSQTGRQITQVGTLLNTQKGTVNSGEFSVPFYFSISLLQ